MRMLQSRGRADLREEPLAPECRAKIGVQHLDRDVAIVLEVAGEIDHGHTAVADLALDGVVALEGGRELILQTWQSGFSAGRDDRR